MGLCLIAISLPLMVHLGHVHYEVPAEIRAYNCEFNGTTYILEPWLSILCITYEFDVPAHRIGHVVLEERSLVWAKVEEAPADVIVFIERRLTNGTLIGFPSSLHYVKHVGETRGEGGMGGYRASILPFNLTGLLPVGRQVRTYAYFLGVLPWEEVNATLYITFFDQPRAIVDTYDYVYRPIGLPMLAVGSCLLAGSVLKFLRKS